MSASRKSANKGEKEKKNDGGRSSVETKNRELGTGEKGPKIISRGRVVREGAAHLKWATFTGNYCSVNTARERGKHIQPKRKRYLLLIECGKLKLMCTQYTHKDTHSDAVLVPCSYIHTNSS